MLQIKHLEMHIEEFLKERDDRNIINILDSDDFDDSSSISSDSDKKR